jgi:alkylated DNA nucleotide flippase Atl1
VAKVDTVMTDMGLVPFEELTSFEQRLETFLRAMLASNPGKWAAYGDVAEAIGSGARAVGQGVIRLRWKRGLSARLAHPSGNTDGWTAEDIAQPGFALIAAITAQSHMDVGLAPFPHITPWAQERRWTRNELIDLQARTLEAGPSHDRVRQAERPPG